MSLYVLCACRGTKEGIRCPETRITGGCCEPLHPGLLQLWAVGYWTMISNPGIWLWVWGLSVFVWDRLLLRLALNSASSYLSLPNAGVISMCQYTTPTIYAVKFFYWDLGFHELSDDNCFLTKESAFSLSPQEMVNGFFTLCDYLHVLILKFIS